MQQRLVKAGLILLRHNQDVEILVELRLGLGLSNVAAVPAHVQLGLGVLLVTILYSAGEGNQDLHIVIFLAFDIPLYLVEIADCRQPGGGDHHHLASPADFVPGGLPERLHDDLRLLTDVVGVQLLIPADHLRRTAGGEVGIVLHGLGNFETGFVGHVVLEYIQDELLLDGLPHTVDVERMEAAVFVLRAKQLQRLIFWGGGESEEGQVPVAALGDDLVHQLIVRVKLLLGLALQLGVLPQGLLGVCQRRFQLEGGAARLRGVGLVHDDGKAAPGGLVHLLEDYRELLQGGDDDPHPGVQSVPQILGGLVLADGLHRPQCVVKARDGLLELGIEDSPIRDHHHAAEHGPVLLAV